MATFDVKYENWKNKLLDLGKRNKLLNYKETKSSTLKITYPSYEDLYDSLVKNENKLTFPNETEDQYFYEDIKETEIDEGYDLFSIKDYGESDYGGNGSFIRTNRSIDELQRVLRNLRNKAKVAIEEQGINVLYLSFGFLQYTEADYSKSVYLAPLVLVPVSLSIESIVSPYVLKLHEDEIVVNPTLAYMLDKEYSLKLPLFDSSGDISDFFDEVERIVKDNHWKIKREVGLSLLSFLKINMYNDLVTHKDTISANPIVKALAGDGSDLTCIPPEVYDYDFDKNDNPKDVFQIVDADASQQEAILLAKKGVSFVLQGPPGTGKSQTITNIIAECLANGKKVLFVSEKMAALEVVHNRITQAGLEDFCLVLHSKKTSKRSVLDQLERVLMLSRDRATMSDVAFQKLNNLEYDKKQLNDYAEQIYSTVSPLEKNIYEVNGIIASLKQYTDVVFGISDVRGTDREQLASFIQVLEAYKDTIVKMADGYETNPWRGTHLNSITNEIRRDITSKLSCYLPVLDLNRQRVDEIYDLLFSKDVPSLNGIQNTINTLENLENAVKIPYEWVIGERILSENDINDCIDRQNRIKTIIETVLQKTNVLVSHGVVEPIDREELYDDKKVSKYEKSISQIIHLKEPFLRWNNNYSYAFALFEEAKEKAEKINALKTIISEEYEDDIYSIDYEGVLTRFKTEYTGLFKSIKSSFKEDKKQFIACHKEIGHKISYDEMFQTVQRLKEISVLKNWFSEKATEFGELFNNDIKNEDSDYDLISLNLSLFSLLSQLEKCLGDLNEELLYFVDNRSILKEKYRFLYNGVLTDWKSVFTAWRWSETFRKSINDNSPSESFIKKTCSSVEYANECVALKNELVEINSSIRSQLSWFLSLFVDPEVFYELNLRELYNRLEKCMNGMALLEYWIDYKVARERCFEVGLKEVVTALENSNIPADDIIPVFKKRFYSLWLDAVLPEHPAVLNFRRKTQEKTIIDFSELDRIQFAIARARIKSMLINALPTLDHFTSGQDEISILKRELAKTRRIMPIRKLFRDIPNLLLTLKPCLMMSPLSVSLFLEADSYRFDTVIFDEASQVYTENAIGAISRGKQVIIAGDSKQLPPTNFFQATSVEDLYDYEDEDEADVDVYDSILDEANMLPERTLQWHYRSLHEDLIAFSNAKIYKNRLITFPSNIEKHKDNGVEYVYISEGFYDRGGRKGNVVEAKKVAQMVFDHFKTQPERSLGVIAFGEVQQVAIENALREMRMADQSFEPFFDETKEEAFFVKSLENVQGDERDTIIFSIGYAKDSSGVFRNQFGPLGKTGGERRLNVAITRAKYNVKLVGSILPSDINEDAVSNDGPKMLKAYIDYAINGINSLKRELAYDSSTEFDSPFEEAVYEFLENNGYKIATQVGCSGYRIDIGVKHPTIDGVFVLGVECDGASYHSARTARERDRLRQDILEKMGWTIYRIWSTDWIKDPDTEGQLLIDAIEKAVLNYGNKQLFTKTDDSGDVEEYVHIDTEEKTWDQLLNPYGFEKYEKVDFYDLPRDRYGYLKIEDCICALVNNEFPIHYEYMCQRLAGLYGNEKVTIKVRREVDYGLNKLSGTIIRKGDFLYPSDGRPIVVKIPNCRKSQHISSDEFAVAMLRILKTYIGATRKTLYTETARVYGFRSVGSTIASLFDEALEILLKQHFVEENDGKLSAVD